MLRTVMACLAVPARSSAELRSVQKTEEWVLNKWTLREQDELPRSRPLLDHLCTLAQQDVEARELDRDVARYAMLLASKPAARPLMTPTLLPTALRTDQPAPFQPREALEALPRSKYQPVCEKTNKMLKALATPASHHCAAYAFAYLRDVCESSADAGQWCVANGGVESACAYLLQLLDPEKQIDAKVQKSMFSGVTNTLTDVTSSAMPLGHLQSSTHMRTRCMRMRPTTTIMMRYSLMVRVD